jgi:histidine triad (HIT) family protein
MSCPFCAIARQDRAAHVVHADDVICAFLDRAPIRPGHTLIVPHVHVATFDEAPLYLVTAIVAFGQQLATAMKDLYGVDRVAFAFTGGDVPHLHAHVIPMHDKTDVTSRRYIVEDAVTFQPMPEAPADQLAWDAASLVRALERT